MREAFMGILVALVGLIGLIEGARLSWFQANAVFRDTLGGGYFVLAVSAAIFVCGMITAVSGWRAAAVGHDQPVQKTGPGVPRSVVVKVVATISLCVAYLLLIGFTGYLISTVAFFLVAFRVAGVRSWPVIVALSLALSAAFYVIFVMYGGIQFPTGSLINFPES